MKRLLVTVNLNGFKFERICLSAYDAAQAIEAAIKATAGDALMDIEYMDRLFQSILEVKSGKVIETSTHYYSIKLTDKAE